MTAKPSIAESPSEALPEVAPPLRTAKPLLSWLALLLVLGVVAPFVPVPSAIAAIGGGAFLVLVYVAAMIGIALGVARLRLQTNTLVVLLALTLFAWALGRFVLIDGVLEPLNRANASSGRRPEAWQVLGGRTIRTLTDLALIMAATWGGALVAQLVKARNLLGPICAMIALIDIWGVLFGGIVSQLLTNPATAEASKKAFTGPPKLGAQAGPASYPVPLPEIGAGDYLFLGLLFAVLVRLGMNWRDPVKWVFPLVAGALLAITFVPQVPFLPGLLFIGAGVAIPNWRYFQFSREERFALLYAGGFVVLLTGALYFALLSQLPPSQAAPASTLAPVPRATPRS